MKITVIGKAHREGTSKKTGKPFSFNEVHYTVPDRGVDGLAAKSINLDSSFCPYGSIQVGGTYNLEFNERGFMVDFAPVASGK